MISERAWDRVEGMARRLIHGAAAWPAIAVALVFCCFAVSVLAQSGSSDSHAGTQIGVVRPLHYFCGSAVDTSVFRGVRSPAQRSTDEAASVSLRGARLKDGHENVNAASERSRSRRVRADRAEGSAQWRRKFDETQAQQRDFTLAVAGAALVSGAGRLRAMRCVVRAHGACTTRPLRKCADARQRQAAADRRIQ
jgi:hypothetical protein